MSSYGLRPYMRPPVKVRKVKPPKPLDVTSTEDRLAMLEQRISALETKVQELENDNRTWGGG